MSTQHESLHLVFDDVGYKVGDKSILSSVTGSCHPGRVCAILGPSGAGKTTFLSLLAGRSRVGRHHVVSGTVSLNGVPFRRGMRRVISFVTQEDILFDTCTPREALRFGIRTKAPGPDREERIDSTIQMLGLDRCKDTVLGVPGMSRGVSGGERKRTNIGVELVAKPMILLLDEPTSGLDSQHALHVVRILKNLARQGCTVVCTLHQPSSHIFRMLDDLMLIAAGRVAYHGPAHELVPHLAQLGHPCPESHNPADFALRLLHFHGPEITPQWDAAVPTRRPDPSLGRTLRTPATSPPLECYTNEQTQSIIERYQASLKSSFCQQLTAHVLRSWLHFKRHPRLFRVRLVQTLLFGVLLGFLYFQLGTNQVAVNDRMGITFISIVNVGMTSMMAGVSTFPPERAIFYRETASGAYSPFAYLFGKFFAELPFTILFPTLFATILYWLVGYVAEFGRFMIFLLVVNLCVLSSTSFGLLLGAIIPSAEAAISATPAVMLPLILVAGLFVSSSRVNTYLIWLRVISPFRYANVATLVNEFSGIGEITTDKGEIPVFKNGNDVLKAIEFDDEKVWVQVVALIALSVVGRLIAGAALYRAARKQ